GGSKQAGKDKEKDKDKDAPLGDLAVTHHQVTIGGQTIYYTATAGYMPLPDYEGKPKANIFFVAYTRDSGPPPAPKPAETRAWPGIFANPPAGFDQWTPEEQERWRQQVIQTRARLDAEQATAKANQPAQPSDAKSDDLPPGFDKWKPEEQQRWREQKAK